MEKIYKTLTMMSFLCCLFGFLFAVMLGFTAPWIPISVKTGLTIGYIGGFGGMFLMVVFSVLASRNRKATKYSVENSMKELTLGIKGLICEKYTFYGVENDHPAFTGMIKNIHFTKNKLRDETYVVFTVWVKEWDRHVEIAQYVNQEVAPMVGERIRIIGYRA